MDRDEAILHTADFIEKHPERYDFFYGQVPESETAKACALAWLGFFLGMSWETYYYEVADATGLPSDLAKAVGLLNAGEFGMPWRDPKKVAQWLRSLAQR